DGQAHTCRWKVDSKASKASSVALDGYWRQLDNLEASDVVWTPYGEDVHVTCPRTLYYGWLQYRDICEPYMPARVMRQVGMVQTIPPTILHPTKVTRSQGKHNYKLDFPLISASDGWKTFPILGSVNILHYTPVTSDDAGATHTDYMEWYQKYSHPFVLPPERRTIETTKASTCLVPIS
ncbi:Serine/threonine-protein phosphatase 7 long form homolog, partial [Striga hermonthica]